MSIETKEGSVIKSISAAENDMEQINRYTRRKFSADEVYIFSAVLCDNEIDRAFERFSVSALEELKKMFVGKTCIFDHDRKSSNQTARIFATSIEVDLNRKTEFGENYTKLTARAYIPKTEKNAEIIEQIESGILKEVSISCSVSSSKCSICEKEHCSHIKGRRYADELCCRVLDKPKDAYECSFVAVPAQREAGVRKSYYERKGVEMEEILKSIKLGEAISIEKTEAVQLAEYIGELEEKAHWGKAYRDSMCADIIKFSALVQPDMPENVMRAAVNGLSVPELSVMQHTYEKMAQKTLPIATQLSKPKADSVMAGNKEFKI